ncbi:MAG TPA: LacI family DNA-binding transcriptional regulator [Streptosporangiaceae bacterium]|nr:LacI family DNA-binding transcriptional regulator [Streptosporangiaceae bacterium]
MAGREPTLRDVARDAGVHPSTVSRCLDPTQAGRIGDETRERVLRAARALNYRPHPEASNLRRRRSHSVGVLIPDLTNAIHGMLLRGVSDKLESEGYTSVVIETRDSDSRLGRALAVLRERRVEGVVNAAARHMDGRRLREFMRSGTPVVFAVRDIGGVQATRVLADDFRGGALAAEHLLSLGHQRIAQITGPAQVAAFVERSRGMRSALLETGVAAEPPTVEAASGTVEEGRSAAVRLLRATRAPTAIFAHNDLLAIGAIAALREAGLRCPDDVSVLGYNDTPLTECLAPALSTIRLPAVEIGQLAAERLLAELHGEAAPTLVSLQPRLIARDSTGPCPRAGR